MLNEKLQEILQWKDIPCKQHFLMSVFVKEDGWRGMETRKISFYLIFCFVLLCNTQLQIACAANSSKKT